MILSELPQEIIEELAEYLSLTDLLSCSAVNKDWRNAFNINLVWRRFCTFHPNYFSCHESKLNTFAGEVSEICEARETLLNEQCVKNNILQGKYKVAQVKIGAVYCDNVVDHIDQVGNHWLFMSSMKNLDFESEHVLSVWNLNSSPILHKSVETPLGLTNRKLDTEMKVNETKLFYLQDRIVLIYNFSHPDYELKFLHKIEQCLYPKSVISMAVSNGLVLSFIYSQYHYQNDIKPYVCVWDEAGLLIHQNYDTSVFKEQLQIEYNSPTPYQIVRTSGSTILVAFLAFGNVLTMLLFKTKKFHYEDLSDLEILTGNGQLNIDLAGNNIAAVTSFPSSFTCYVYSSWFDTRYPTTLYYQVVDPPIKNFSSLFDSEGKDLVVLFNDFAYVFYDNISGKPVRFLIQSGDARKATLWKNNVLVNQYSAKNKVKTDVWNYKTGQKLYALDLGSAFGFEQVFYDFRFIESFSSPAKIVAFQDPVSTYAHLGKKSRVAVISFW